MPIGTYTPPLWKTITPKKFSIFLILFFHFRCILLQISHKKCFFISISILGRSGVKEECSVFKKYYIMDENDSLSEYNNIPLGHNRTNGAVYSKIDFKVEICSALSVFDSHPALHFPRLYCSIIITIIATVFLTLLTTTTIIVTI